MSIGWKLLLAAGIALVMAELFQCDLLYGLSIVLSALALFPKR